MSRKKIDRSNAVFAAALIVSASVCLTYNFISASDTSLTAVFSDATDHSVISTAAASNLSSLNTAAVSVSPINPAEAPELLAPIILPPES